MKTKYINADEFRAMMFHGAFEDDSDLQRLDGGCWIRYRMFERALEQIEPADVQEVKHGRWIWDDLGYHCSECWFNTSEDMLEIMTNVWHYCPVCGSLMNEEV